MIYRLVTKCFKGHPLLRRYGYFSGRFCEGEYFCKICGYIDMVKLMFWVDRKIREFQRLRSLR